MFLYIDTDKIKLRYNFKSVIKWVISTKFIPQFINQYTVITQPCMSAWFSKVLHYYEDNLVLFLTYSR